MYKMQCILFRITVSRLKLKMLLAFILPILIGFSSAQVNKLLTQLNPLLAKVIETECLGNTNLNLRIIENIQPDIKLDKETQEILRCVPYCVFTKLHILDSEGKFQPKPNRNIFTHTAKSEEEIAECVKEDSDPCSRALQFAECILEDEDSNDVKNVEVEIKDDTNTANNLGVEDVTVISKIIIRD